MLANKVTDAFTALTALAIDYIPAPLKAEPSWITWQPKLKQLKTHTKTIKQPTGGRDWQNKLSTYEEILESYAEQMKEYPTGLGFVMSDKHAYVCVDIDDMSPENIRCIKELNTYTEKSPSGKGVHAWVQLVTLDSKLKLYEDFGTKKFSKTNARDLFITSGYVTITGDKLNSYPSEIQVFSYEGLTHILAKYFNVKIATLPIPAQSPNSNALNAGQVRALLKQINVCTLTSDIFDKLSDPVELAILNPDETEEAREPWLIICQAVHNNFNGDATGLAILHEWSSKGTKYDKASLVSVYESFSTDPKYLNQINPITIASLIALVRAQRPELPDVNSKGKPLPTLDNLDVFLKFYKIKMNYNILSCQSEIILPKHLTKTLGFVNHKINDIDMANRILSSEMIKLGLNAASYVSMRDSLLDYAKQNSFNPIEQYFKDLENVYDPTKDPLGDLIKSIDVEYSDRLKSAIPIFIRKWLIQVAAAAHTSMTYSENIFNTILIFTGAQGIGKTKWVASLFPESIKEYCAGSGSLNVTGFKTDIVKQAMELQRTLICNINEIDILFKPKNFSLFKQLLDDTTSTMVLPYGRSATTLTRRTVFIGSTNKTNFLQDQTGNRRFVVIPVVSLDFNHNVDIDQLWAHVIHWFKSGEPWWINPEKSEAEKNAAKMQSLINLEAMYEGDEFIIEDLDAYFDLQAPKRVYKRKTFAQIRRSVPTLNALTSGNKQFNIIKDTFVVWLKQTKHGKVIPKSKGTRVPQYYLVPPLLSDAPVVSFKQVAESTSDTN